MKKYSSYIVLLLLVAAIAFIAIKGNTGRGTTRDTNAPDPIALGNLLPPDDSVTPTPSGTKINIYMENSGSMDGYVNLNSEFKDALGKVIVKSNSNYKDTRLYFVNNQIYDVDTALRGDVNNFVGQLNSKTMKIGSTVSSNINKIFQMVLDKTDKSTVSILFSDFVYSIQGTDVSNQVYKAKNATMGAFIDAINKNPEFATIILQCESQFKGNYYNRNDHGIRYTGKRPYYIFIMGSYNRLKEVDSTLCLNKSNTGIPGLKNKYFLSTKTWTLNEDNIQALTNSYTDADRIKPMHNGLDIDFIKFDKSNSTISFAYAFGLNNLFIDSSYLQDKSNYDVTPQSVNIIKADYTTDEAALSEVPQFKHPFVLNLQLKVTELSKNIRINLLNKVPAWVNKANVTDDVKGVPQEGKTFAIASLIEGVYEAFKDKIGDKPIFTVELTINEFKK